MANKAEVFSSSDCKSEVAVIIEQNLIMYGLKDEISKNIIPISFHLNSKRYLIFIIIAIVPGNNK